MNVVYAEVIGDPISQSKSPIIHKHWLSALGMAGDYAHAHVTAEGLGDYIAARRGDALWRGCNVTMPHKQAIIPLLDHIDPLAARIGAVNTVVRGEDGMLTGYNTDAPGCLEPLAPVLAAGRKRVLVLGNGGAARAILVALADAGQVLTLAARNPAKARALLDELAPGPGHQAVDLAPLADAGEGRFDLVINASPLGMLGNPPLAFDLSHMAKGGVVYDIVTAPLETPLLKAARQAGLPTVDGLAMLIGQAAIAFEHFFGMAPARGDGDAALRAALTA
ncbi:MAG: shikimate dehydrogenase [Sphingomonadales bacterium]|nr:shikimate dehydrogenase [Sphingomonadales bacterium]MDE2170829.1 shikimate dehydrogenase [Sphingomonadales bacterium]